MAIYILVCVPAIFSLQKSKKVPGAIEKTGWYLTLFYFKHQKTLR